MSRHDDHLYFCYLLLFCHLWLWLTVLEADLHHDLFIPPQNLDFEDIPDRFPV